VLDFGAFWGTASLIIGEHLSVIHKYQAVPIPRPSRAVPWALEFAFRTAWSENGTCAAWAWAWRA